MDIINKSQTISKKAMRFGTDTLLHPSEIHMVVNIAGSREPHVIGLAKELGITKGAVSQIIRKLERKGIIKRNIDINNRSKYLLTLTTKGLHAYHQHEKLHQSVNLAYMHILKKYPDNDIKNILQLLKELNNEAVEIN